MAETMLAEAIQEHRASGGAIIIVDPYTMDILALASSPGLTYSNLDLDDPEQRLLLQLALLGHAELERTRRDT